MMKAATFALLLMSVVGCASTGARSRHGQPDPAASVEVVGEMQLEEELHRLDLLEAEIYAHSPSDAPGNPRDRCADGDREVMSRMQVFKLMMGNPQKQSADGKYYGLLQRGTPEELLPAIYLRRYYFEGLLECVRGLTGAEPRDAREEHHVSILTQSNFDAETSRGLVLVDFMTHWCGPCKIMAPELQKLARDHRGEIRVGRLTADRHRELIERFEITTFPMLVLLKDGEEVARNGKYRRYPDLLAWVRDVTSGQSSPSSAHLPRGDQTSAGDAR
ncbi:thioredoxin family protein [Sorangium sp. So ce887]|uniref:thioredoxin family protein n=1 Tax=Sorangium sp. So ce887 TaxID=3133324 RepID=UPI003F5FCA45